MRRLQRLDAILDLGVLTVDGLQDGDVVLLLVSDKALEAVAVQVGEGQLRAGVRALAPADKTRPGRPAFGVDPVGELGDPCSLALLPVDVDRWAPSALSQREDRLPDWLLDRIADREADARLAAGEGELVRGAPAASERARISPSSAVRGSCSSASSRQRRWSAALPAAALPGRRVPASTSRPHVTSNNGLKPKPPL